MWHDGVRRDYEDDWGVPSLTPFRLFCGLRSSLERSADLQEQTWDQEAFDDPVLGAPEHVGFMFDRQYVILLHREQPLVMDCRNPEDPNSPTGVYAYEGIGRTITLAERIGWWHWALDNRFWIPTSDGEWDVDITRAPGQLIGLHARDNVD